MDILHSILSQLGLSINQCTVYLSLLEIGQGPASTIASKAGINRVTCHDTLKQLISHGVVYAIPKNNITIYYPHQPEYLLEKQQDIVKNLESSLGLFHQLSKANTLKPLISYYQGFDQVKNAYRKLLSSSKQLHSFLGSNITNTQLLDFIDEEFEQERVQKKIKQYVICSHTNTAFIKQPQRLREKLGIDKTIFQTSCAIHVFGNDKVMLNFFSEHHCALVIIQSNFLHDTVLNVFQTMWKLCESLDKNNFKK